MNCVVEGEGGGAAASSVVGKLVCCAGFRRAGDGDGFGKGGGDVDGSADAVSAVGSGGCDVGDGGE